MSDWDAGEYELSARQLLPVAERAVALAELQHGQRLLDIACGTGNASFVAAAAGARVTGVDSAPRLLSVAAHRAEVEQVEIEFVTGDAVALPVEDGAVDAAVSVMGVIFAEPAEQAVAELLRVVRPGGRVVVTSWEDSGPLLEASKPLRAAVAEVRGESARPGSDWGTADGLRELFAGHDVVVHEEEVAFTSSSPQQMADDFFDKQPMWLAAQPIVGAEAYERARRETVEVLAELNEDPDAWRATSRYLVGVVTR